MQYPFARLTRSELYQKIEDYAAEFGLGDRLDLLKKGALVAQNPALAENIEELSPDEKHHLRMEQTNK